MKRELFQFDNGSRVYIDNVQWFDEIFGSEIGSCEITVDGNIPKYHTIWVWDDAESGYVCIENLDDDGDEYETVTISKSDYK